MPSAINAMCIGSAELTVQRTNDLPVSRQKRRFQFLIFAGCYPTWSPVRILTAASFPRRPSPDGSSK